MSDDALNVVTFHDAAGKEVGTAQPDGTGRWQRIPHDIAYHMFVWTDQLTPEMAARGEVIGLFRVVGLDVQLWAGTAAEAWAKCEEPPPPPDEAFGARFQVQCDARVLHADGTWC